MKKSIFPVLLLAVTCLLPLTSSAKEDTPLGKQMESLNDVYKGMRKEQDAAKGAALAREAQDHILKAIVLVPAMLEKLKDAAAKEKAVAEYKAQMGQLYVSFCQVESAFLAKDLEKVTKIMEEMRGQKKEGHGKFIEEEE